MDNAGKGQVSDEFKGTQRFEHSHHGAANRGLPGVDGATKGNLPPVDTQGGRFHPLDVMEFNNNEAKKKSYGDELRAMMKQKDRDKRDDKVNRFYDDLDALEDQFSYNPFGKGGGGAPLRDQFGNMITTRKPNMRGDMARTHFKNL